MVRIDTMKKMFSTAVCDMELSTRSLHCLHSAGIWNMHELVAREESELLEIRNLGRKSLSEIEFKLSDMGLKLGMKNNNNFVTPAKHLRGVEYSDICPKCKTGKLTFDNHSHKYNCTYCANKQLREVRKQMKEKKMKSIYSLYNTEKEMMDTTTYMTLNAAEDEAEALLSHADNSDNVFLVFKSILAVKRKFQPMEKIEIE